MRSRAVIFCLPLLGLIAGLHPVTWAQRPPAGFEPVVHSISQWPTRPDLPPLPPPVHVFRDPDQGMQQGFPRGQARPVSDWLESEKRLHAKLLAGSKHDTLLVPFQITAWGFDRPTRALMSAELWLALSRATTWKIADPSLVAKALGEGQREYAPLPVLKLAESVGARRIIWAYAGHDRKGKMIIMLRSLELVDVEPGKAAPRNPEKNVELRDLPMVADAAPIEAFEAALPTVMKQLGLDMPAALAPRSASSLALAELPATPARLVSSGENAAQDAYALLLLRALTPRMLESTQEAYAAKAYLALLRMTPDAPEYRALRARTLLALGARMAALKTLGTPRTDEERAVLALANGDLPRLRELAAREKNPLKRLLIKLEENRVAAGYGVRNQKQAKAEAVALKLPEPAWSYLVMRAYLDSENWSQFDNAYPKYLLDSDFPLPGYTLKEMVQGASSLGDEARVQSIVDLSVVDHVRRLAARASPEPGCCSFVSGRFAPGDYLELLQAIGHDNLMRRITFLSSTQGLPDAAMGFANSIDPIYRGHPYYAAVRSQAQLKQSSQHAGDGRREGLRKAGYTDAVNALYWEQGQSYVSQKAWAQITQLRGNADGAVGYPYFGDLPFRPYSALDTPENWQEAMRNATFEVDTFQRAYRHYEDPARDGSEMTALLKALDGRFNGAPQKNALLAQHALRGGNRKAAEEYHRANTRLAPAYWRSHDYLGHALFERGELREAATIWLAYAGFGDDSEEHPVEVANNAAKVGTLFYGAGHPELAVPFYRIATAKPTGASSDIRSKARLELLAGNFSAAIAGFFDGIQRYRSADDLRDYLGMLHAAGYPEEAWQTFSHAVREMPRVGEFWDSALTGHRREGRTEADVLAWAQRPEFAQSGPGGNATALSLLRFATTDRIPSAELADAINRLDQPVWWLSEHSLLVQSTGEGRGHRVRGPDTDGKRASLLPGVFDQLQKRQVRSDLAYFAAAYRELKLGNHAAAKAVFDEAGALYDLKAGARYMLAYYVHAQAMAGAPREAEALLARFKPDEQRFDYLLARAALDSALGRKDAALQNLKLAPYRRSDAAGRPQLPEYTYGEIAEMLAEQSGDPRMRDVALDWAKKFQKIEPWQAWSYAVEARIGKEPTERARAMAMAKYLDPGSLRLSRLKKAEVEQAERAHAKSNPFVILRQAKGKGSDS